jgi:hypothetical protein
MAEGENPRLGLPLVNLLTRGVDIFWELTANGQKGSQYQNIRRNTNMNSPVESLSSNDLRCNVGGGSGSSTSTVSVSAGSSVTFHSDVAVYHQGPVSLYVEPTARIIR